MVKAIRYRARQFLQALTVRTSDEEVDRAIATLKPEAQVLFRRQAIQDQRHALEVYYALRQAGHTEEQLLTAALLHDVGKAAAPLPPWQRAIAVLLERISPRLLARLVQGEPSGWRCPFAIYARHAEIGALWAQQAGCSPLIVTLIRRHEERLASCQTEQDRFRAALQAADRVN